MTAPPRAVIRLLPMVVAGECVCLAPPKAIVPWDASTLFLFTSRVRFTPLPPNPLRAFAEMVRDYPAIPDWLRKEAEKALR